MQPKGKTVTADDVDALELVGGKIMKGIEHCTDGSSRAQLDWAGYVHAGGRERCTSGDLRKIEASVI